MKKAAYVYEVFQDVAEGYDSANERISAGQQDRWKRSAVHLLCEALGAQPHVLDIGCGTGDMLKRVHEQCPQSQLTGIDFSPHMLAQARVRCAEIEGLTLIEGDALNLPFEDECFDGATMSFALRNTSDYEQALREAFRVLRPGARFVCIDSFVPTNRLVRPFYHLYFSVVMPLLGGGVRKLRQYRWLSKSTREFLSVHELSALMAEVGFTHVRQKSFMYGACSCVMGDRPFA